MNHVRILKRLLVLIWAVWLSVVLLSNLADAAKASGLLGESWVFASGNLKFIKETTIKYGVSDPLNAILFAGVILWEAFATVLFWKAFFDYRGKNSGPKILYHAFTATLSLWGAFLVADEICMAYELESSHLRLFISHLLTLLAIELLPEE